MTESRTTLVDRRNIAALATTGVLAGLGSLFVGEARAQDGGAAAMQVANLIVEFKKYQDTFDSYIKKFDEFKNKTKDYVDSYFDGIRAVEELKGTVDKFFFGNTKTFGFKIDSIKRELESFVKERVDEVEALSKAHSKIPPGQRNKRSIVAAKARSKAGMTLGEVGARETRARYVAFGEHLEKSPVKGKATAEAFTASSGPMVVEQNQLMLESSLRQEALLTRILELLGEGDREEQKPYNKENFAKDFDRFKAGKGTLLVDKE